MDKLLFSCVELSSHRSISTRIYRGNDVSAFLKFVNLSSTGVSARGQTIILPVLSSVPANYSDHYILIPIAKDLENMHIYAHFVC